jgi:ribulose-5-phosphate 4-epimerase/fuculose-1-phosphate aldolase
VSRHGNSEAAAREDLATAFQIAGLLGWDDSIYTHFSVRVPGTDNHFLINPFGLQFAEVTASRLVKIDTNGNKVEPSEFDVNPAGFTIHSAIHTGRHDAACIVHTHTVCGVAVSSLEDGLQPNNQWGFQFYGRVAYHEFEGIALNLDERERIVENLGQSARALILRNHGLLTIGRTIPEAFILMHNFERACRVQIALASTGQKIRQVPIEIQEHTAQQFERVAGDDGQGDLLIREWNAFRRSLEAQFGAAHSRKDC